MSDDARLVAPAWICLDWISVHRVTKEYATGVKRTKAQMKEAESQIERLPGLEKWFVDVFPNSLDQTIP